jgi:predicted RNA binding protein YcfA (HicA-like mRNA interferase family)
MSFREMVRHLESLGFQLDRIRGDHYRFKHPQGLRTVGLCHNRKNKFFGRAAICKIMREAAQAVGKELR